MNQYDITTEVFAISQAKNRHILYAPVAGVACLINDETLNLLSNIRQVQHSKLSEEHREILNFLIQKRIVNGSIASREEKEASATLSPSKLTLFPTHRCQLNCCYCYAEEQKKIDSSMSQEHVENAIEYYTGVMKRENRSIFNLELHGGGEPFADWDLGQFIISLAEKYCQENNFKLQAVAGTNGIFNKIQLEWILRHFHSLNISFEGLPRIQAIQRPFKNGANSFDVVDQSIKFFDSHNFPYALRVTVTRHNEQVLPETIQYILDNYKTGLIHVEPAYSCGNLHDTAKALQPDMEHFAETYFHLETMCRQRNVRLQYSGCRFDRLKTNFCYVGTDDFAVTTDGYLTNCWEVSDRSHPAADTFIFGKLLPHGKLEIDHEKLKFLKSLNLDNFEYCTDCFAKYQCAGDCVLKLGH
ncbi:radical SAM protein, partial [candidate division KSB1 bacterium]|nr:radical SAM protein [candidate division KSB1 bacterium]